MRVVRRSSQRAPQFGLPKHYPKVMPPFPSRKEASFLLRMTRRFRQHSLDAAKRCSDLKVRFAWHADRFAFSNRMVIDPQERR